MNKNHSVIFEIVPKYCILHSFVDYEGYSTSSEGFLPTVVDIMMICFWAPKSLQMVTAAMKLKDAYSLEVETFHKVARSIGASGRRRARGGWQPPAPHVRVPAPAPSPSTAGSRPTSSRLGYVQPGDEMGRTLSALRSWWKQEFIDTASLDPRTSVRVSGTLPGDAAEQPPRGHGDPPRPNWWCTPTSPGRHTGRAAG